MALDVKPLRADDFLGRLEQVEGLREHLTESWHDAEPVIHMTPGATAEVPVGGLTDQGYRIHGV